MIANAGSWFVRAAAFAIVWCWLSGTVHAQQPSAAALASAKELVELKSGAGMFDAVITGTVDQIKNILLQTNPQLSKDLSDTAAALKTEFAPRRAELVAEAARLYAARFTDQELKETVAFYKTPLGKKIIVQDPLILEETFRFTRPWSAKVSEELLNRFRAEMKKKGHDL